MVIPLSNLLPKTSSLLEPPIVPQNDEYLDYVEALCVFMSGYDEALEFAVEVYTLYLTIFSRIQSKLRRSFCLSFLTTESTTKSQAPYAN